MSKKKQKNKLKSGQPQGQSLFGLGDPEPVLSGTFYDDLGSYLIHNGKYYETPVPLKGLARLRGANAYHGPILEFKTNVLMRDYIESHALSWWEMYCAATDFMTFSNAYFQKIYNFFGEVCELRHIPAINVRKLREAGQYAVFDDHAQLVEFEPGEVLHIKNYDVSQKIYGLPSYLGAIQSMLLNEDATLFRRRYYRNGAHMGYIFYSASPHLTQDDAQKIETTVKSSKGIGNFRNVFLHTPNGREKDFQILPVGDFSTKDELEKIKNISRDDIIAAHRIPPAMANIIPTAAGGLGDIEKTDRVYKKNEIVPLQRFFLSVNEHLSEERQIAFASSVVEV